MPSTRSLLSPRTPTACIYTFTIDTTDPYNVVLSAKKTSAPTGISAVSAPVSTPADYYTIDGRKLQLKPRNSGIYIVGGRKIVVK